MNTYLSSLIPRIQQFSKKLKNKEQIIGKIWHLLQPSGYPVGYTFTRNDEVFKTRPDGLTVKGGWELIPATSQISIVFPDLQTMFKIAFLDNDILILSDPKGMIYPFVNANLGITIEQELVDYLEKKVNPEKPIRIPKSPPKIELLGVFMGILFLFLFILLIKFIAGSQN